MGVVGAVHGRYVHTRRVDRLSRLFAALIPPDADVVDVGCGDGKLAHRVAELRTDITMRGIDVLVRPGTAIPVAPFDGRHIPFEDASVDAVMFVDVLHHADDAQALLREAARVARSCVIIKDHLREGVGAEATLRFMDWVGNARFGVSLPYRYWSRSEWTEAFAALGLTIDVQKEDLALYPQPASLFFDRSLHFVARLRRT
jgi:SAM-dependent methyltransferase